MSELTPKNLLLDWHTPVATYRGKTSTPEDFILIKKIDPEIHEVKYSAHTVELKADAMRFFFKEGEETFTLAVSFGKDKKLYFVFNPVKGTPFYKSGKSGSGIAFNNRDLVDKIFEHLKLDPKKSKYYLKAHLEGDYDTMKVWRMTPQSYDEKLPIWEDELLGK